MAEREEVTLIIRAKDFASKNLKNISGAMGQVGGVAAKMGGIVGRAFLALGRTIIRVVGGILSSIAKLTAGLGLIVSAATFGFLLTKAVNEVANFGKGLAEAGTLIEKSEGQMGLLRLELKRLRVEFAQTGLAETTALYKTFSGGVTDTADALRLLESANVLALAGVTSVDAALQLLLSTMKPFQIAFSQAERVAAKLFLTVKRGQVTIPELASALSQITPLAAQLGVSLDETLGAIAAITSATTLSTEQATTQLRSFFAGIIDGAEVATKINREFGTSFDFSQAAIQTRGFTGFIADLNEEMNKLGGDQGNAVMKQLIGRIEGLLGFLTLAGVGFKDLARNVPELAEALREAQVAMEEMRATSRFSIDQMKQGFGSFLESVGKQLEPQIIKLTKSFTNFFQNLERQLETTGTAFGDLIEDKVLATMGRVRDAMPELAAGVIASIGLITEFLNIFLGASLQLARALLDIQISLTFIGTKAAVAEKALGALGATPDIMELIDVFAEAERGQIAMSKLFERQQLLLELQEKLRATGPFDVEKIKSQVAELIPLIAGFAEEVRLLFQPSPGAFDPLLGLDAARAAEAFTRAQGGGGGDLDLPERTRFILTFKDAMEAAGTAIFRASNGLDAFAKKGDLTFQGLVSQIHGRVLPAVLAIGDAVSRSFTAITDGTRSAGEAFREFGRTMIQTLVQLIVKLLVVAAIMGLIAVLSGGTFSAGALAGVQGALGIAASVPTGGTAAEQRGGAPSFRPSAAGLRGGRPVTPITNPAGAGRSFGELNPAGLPQGGGGGRPVVVNFNVQTLDSKSFDQGLEGRKRTITGIIRQALDEDQDLRNAIRGA